MQLSESRHVDATSNLEELGEPISDGFIERRGLFSWFLGGTITIAAVAGLVGVALFLSRNNDSSMGVWAQNQPTLMVILVLTNLLFIGYAAYQQHMIMAARRRRQHRRLLAILTVSRITGAETNPQNIFDSITDICRKTFESDQVSMMTYDHRSKSLKVCSASGHKDLTRVLGSELKLGKSIAGWVADQREPLILGPRVDRRQFRDFEAKVDDLSAAMVVPIAIRNELFGVLSVSSRSRKTRYDEEDLEALQVFAETAGICCRHSEQTNWMRQTIQRMDRDLTDRDGSLKAA